MGLNEWEYEFDILYNNISSNKAPNFNALEKSIILTQAQEIVYKELYTGSNGQKGFEGSEEVTQYLKNHVHRKELDVSERLDSEQNMYRFTTADNHASDIWWIVSESVTISGSTCKGSDYKVVIKPVTHDEYLKIRENPFRRSSVRRVLRLTEEGDSVLIFPDGYQPGIYYVEYLKRPNPIILPGCNKFIVGTADNNDYPQFYTEDNKGQNCEFPDSLHRTILIKAVEIAKSVWA